MRNGYRLVDTQKAYRQRLLSPVGEKIALGTQKTNLTFVINSSLFELRLTEKDFSTMQAAYEHIAELHYQANTTRPERIRNWIAEWNPVWGWLFGAAATVAAIWGWIDKLALLAPDPPP